MPFTTTTRHNQSGFTLVEALMSLLILSGGLLALASAFANGLILVSASEHHQIAKEKASEAMESVFTSRDAGKIPSWDWIQNRSRSENGLFLDGAQPVLEPGTDGLVNTSDDGGPEILPGPDGVTGTGDDESLASFSREIEIRDIRTNLRRIRVTVRYTVNGITRQYQLTSFITPFS